MKRVRMMTVAVCVGVSLWLTGCWDGVDLQQRALVLMIGVDPADSVGPFGSTSPVDKNGALIPGAATSPSEAVKVTVQLARPHRLGIPPSGGQSSGSKKDSPVITVSEEGRDIGEALRRIQLSLNRTLFFGHLQAVVINRKLAEAGILTVLNPLVQSRVVSRNLWMFVSESPTEQFLKQTPTLDVIPAMYLTNLFRNHVWINRPYDATIGGFHQRLVTPGIDPYTFVITGMDPKLTAPHIDGLAVFSGDRLVGYMTSSRFTGWSMIENQFPKSKLAFSCPEDSGKQFVVDVKSVHSRMRVRDLRRQRPYVEVEVRLRGSVEGGPCVLMETDAELRKLRQAIQQQTASMIASAIRWTQSPLQSDLLGIGREVYRHSPRDWHGDEWWNQMFQRLDVRVHVDPRIDFIQTYHQSGLMYRQG
ncbi:Ger(x)C family spore germination protein [Alicyclobacillus contaminans]|uniref:Ger(x)C family spore germination protein n=1 Tax=Alicyclobacillus contaminans TaxID=392016 RepID=UPI00146F9996|nr:Ger(x)C family spore germination protein [Alicyclobacillus contaminans]